MPRSQAGFTLIELMVVIAIIALLALFAVPQYANHTQRTKVAGALAGVAGIKLAVATCIEEQGSPTGCSSGTHEISAAIASGNAGATIQYVDSVAVTDGVITLASTARAPSSQLMSLILTPDLNENALRWQISGSGCNQDNGVRNPRGINCSVQ